VTDHLKWAGHDFLAPLPLLRRRELGLYRHPSPRRRHQVRRQREFAFRHRIFRQRRYPGQHLPDLVLGERLGGRDRWCRSLPRRTFAQPDRQPLRGLLGEAGERCAHTDGQFRSVDATEDHRYALVDDEQTADEDGPEKDEVD
jgi:hypothetical protein